jgi:hypothetical protein
MSLNEVVSFLEQRRKGITRTAFSVITLCFFFPFVTLSCQNQDLAALSGLQLSLGTTLNPPYMYSSYGMPARYISGEPLAMLSLVVAIAGLIISFLLKKYRKELIATTASGALGALFLLLLKSKIDGDVLQQGQGIQARYSLWFWLAFLLFAAASGLNGWQLSKEKRSQEVQAVSDTTQQLELAATNNTEHGRSE